MGGTSHFSKDDFSDETEAELQADQPLLMFPHYREYLVKNSRELGNRSLTCQESGGRGGQRSLTNSKDHLFLSRLCGRDKLSQGQAGTFGRHTLKPSTVKPKPGSL